MQVSISEFLEKVSKLKTKQEKINALKHNDSLPLRIILQSTFDSTVKWLLPAGDPPPYKPNDLFDQEGMLIHDVTKLRYFVDGFHPNLTPNKREMMFIEMLERVDKKDAEMLCAMINKQLPYGNYGGKITYDIVKEAFPGMMQDEAYHKEEPAFTFKGIILDEEPAFKGVVTQEDEAEKKAAFVKAMAEGRKRKALQRAAQRAAKKKVEESLLKEEAFVYDEQIEANR